MKELNNNLVHSGQIGDSNVCDLTKLMVHIFHIPSVTIIDNRGSIKSILTVQLYNKFMQDMG